MRHRTRNRPPTTGGDLGTVLTVIQIAAALWPAARAVGRWFARDRGGMIGLDLLGAKPYEALARR